MSNPMARFAADRAAARDAKDPMAAVCVLATVDENGLPQARTLVPVSYTHLTLPTIYSV